MLSLARTISEAVDRKRVPAFRRGDVGNLATKLGLTHPVSIQNLIRTLDNLPPAIVTLNIDTVQTPGEVSASGQIGLQSDGTASFRGNVNNPAWGDGINYVYAVALLDVKDASGNVLVFAHPGNLFNLVQASSSNFQQNGFNELIRDNWDTAKTSRYHATLLVSDNVLEHIVSGITEALGVLIVAAIIIFTPGGDDDGPSGCQWAGNFSSSNPNDKGAGAFQGCYRLR
jgi:hypothetical protein